MNEENEYRMRSALAWHLENNFIPPQPPELLEYCLQAIDACNANDPTRSIELPGGVTVTAGQLVDDLRLEDMIAEYTVGEIVMLNNARQALELLINANDIANGIINSGSLDYHAASALSRVFDNPMAGTRELIKYLEKLLEV